MERLCGVKITLSDEAFCRKDFRNRIENGELEKIIFQSRGYLSLIRNYLDEYQNVAYMNSTKNAIMLAKKLMDLPYVRGINLGKTLNAQKGYIKVKTPKPPNNKKNEEKYYKRMVKE